MQVEERQDIQITGGGINIEVSNILPEEVKRLEQCFIKLIEAQIHRIGNGNVTLHFQQGKLRHIDIQTRVWNA